MRISRCISGRISGFIIGAALVVCLVSAPASADQGVSATVDRSAIDAGESLELTVTVDGGEADIDTSAITDFSIHSQQTGSYTQIINGRYSKKVVYTYVLIPKRTGKLQIPALSAEIDGRTYLTDPIAVTVSQNANNNSADADRDVYVTTTVSVPAPFVGQQLIYTFSLYNAVQISDARFQPPEFKGFNAKEIKERRNYRKIINGREFAVAEIRYVLVPLEAGDQTIDPAMLQVGVIRQDRRRRSPFDDFFDSPFLDRGSVQPKILQSRPLSLKVKPLPPYDGPGTFSGLVGRFKMTGALENTQLQVGDSTTLTLTIEGQGNIMDAQAPGLSVPAGFKSYADNPQVQVQLTPDGYTGKKVFRIALVPVAAGKYELSPVSWTYFDDNKGIYQTLSVDLPELFVTPGARPDAAPLLVTPQAPAAAKEKVAFTGHDILPLMTDLDAIKPQHPFAPWLFLLWLVVPAVLYGGLAGVQHWRHRDAGPAARMKEKASQSLKAAGFALHKTGKESTDEFLTRLYKALNAGIFAAAGRSGEALTWREAESLLLESGRDADTARQAAELLTAIESAKFSGLGVNRDQGERMLEQTRTLLRRLAT